MSVLRSVYNQTRRLQLVAKNASRLREVSSILVRYGFGYLTERRAERNRPKSNEEVADEVAHAERNQQLYVRVASALAALGPTFIKFGQILSTRPDLIPEGLVRELETLQDNVSPLGFEEIAAQIQKELGKPPAELFAEFDPQPLASASIAQVHRAVTKTGDKVVIKVQRPGIKPKIDGDLNILYFLARQVEEVFPEARLFNLLGIVSEFELNIQRETNFQIEAQNIDRFRKNFAGSDTIHIPAVYKDLSTSEVLTMELIEGRKVTDLMKSGEDLTPLAKRFLNAAFQMLYVDGFFHGDAHPGNLFIMNDGRIGLIDFGMVGRLSQDMREKVIDVIFALLREDMRAVARTFYELGTPQAKVNYTAFEQEVVETLEQEVVGRPLSELQVGLLFRKICEGAIKFQIRMPTDFTMMFKAMVTAEGLAKMIAPNVNVIDEARPHIMKMVAERYSWKRISQEAVDDLRQLAKFARGAPTAGTEILRQLQGGDLELKLKHEGSSDYQQSKLRSEKRLQQTLFVCTLVFSGTWALPDLHFRMDGWPVVTIVMWTLAGILSPSLLVSWLRDPRN